MNKFIFNYPPPMKIAIGTQNPAKIDAIKSGVEKCHYFDNQQTEFLTQPVDSGVSDMPKSLEENIQGAKNRSKNLLDVFPDADFFVGMEGGTTRIYDKSYLFGVIYITDKNGKEHFGVSNMMEVPQEFDKRIYQNNEELGTVLEELSGEIGASKKNGAFGAWSDDLLTRKDQFVFAFLSAIPPFFNQYYKI